VAPTSTILELVESEEFKAVDMKVTDVESRETVPSKATGE
jgi:hypothetical protein